VTKLTKKPIIKFYILLAVILSGLIITYDDRPLPSEFFKPLLPKSTIPVRGQVFEAQVMTVIDGDTIRVEWEGREEIIRLIGINTPETEYSPQGEDCFGLEASLHAGEILKNQLVTVTTDPKQMERDKYNRLLGYVTLTDGRDFGSLMLSEGYAKEYTYQATAYTKQNLYNELEGEARDKKVGLWGRCGN